MSMAHQYDSDWDYYDAQLTPVQRHLAAVEEGDEGAMESLCGYLESRGLLYEIIAGWAESKNARATLESWAKARVKDEVTSEGESQAMRLGLL